MSMTKRFLEQVEEAKEKDAEVELDRMFDLGVDHIKTHLSEKSLSHGQLLNLAATFYVSYREALELFESTQEDVDRAIALLEEVSEHSKTATQSTRDLVDSIPAAIAAAHLRGRMAYSKAIARKGAMAMLANDPRQEAKRFVYECWQEWQAGRTAYSSQAAFARDMLSKWDGVLVSQPSIEAWCRQWKKDNE